ncbi:PadR family transcriptional regulator [Lacticaseibacillus parahuelsenbergensis]|uniref:PadR family transcriptional regulator n=1 Tax=Lacticaseibacillus parahuelsenbergensis TaxID=3068305 RepID=A0ABY9KZQ8_9LACO|nr:PadR family transcriptional regulator [Lacticaseibacillus sp. NCIMB 15471]WLV77029.1 PadR family transcriptional regulator [Lacticaseibacillus sp. NCIMB 15471]
MARDDNSQMLKGILQGCLLILLARKEQYGYAISESLNLFGFENVPKGTIYPLLMTMEKKGLLTSHMRPSPDGPSRKYYAITADGEKAKQTFILQWHDLKSHVDQIIANQPEEA